MKHLILAASTVILIASCGGGGDDNVQGAENFTPSPTPTSGGNGNGDGASGAPQPVTVPDSDEAPEPSHPQQININVQQQQQQIQQDIQEEQAQTGQPPQLSGTLLEAPANGATVCGVVRVRVRTTGALNVEMVPVGAFTPRFGNFAYQGEGNWELNYNTEAFIGETLNVRVLAWDALPGDAGRQITIMEPRQWFVACNQDQDEEGQEQEQVQPPEDDGNGQQQEQQQDGDGQQQQQQQQGDSAQQQQQQQS